MNLVGESVNKCCTPNVPATILGDTAAKIIQVALEVRDQSKSAQEKLFGQNSPVKCCEEPDTCGDCLETRLETALSVLREANNTLADILPKI